MTLRFEYKSPWWYFWRLRWCQLKNHLFWFKQKACPLTSRLFWDLMGDHKIRFYDENFNSCFFDCNWSLSWDSHCRKKINCMDLRLCYTRRCNDFSAGYNYQWLPKIKAVYEVKRIKRKNKGINCFQKWKYYIAPPRFTFGRGCCAYNRRNVSASWWYFNLVKLTCYRLKCNDRRNKADEKKYSLEVYKKEELNNWAKQEKLGKQSYCSYTDYAFWDECTDRRR